MKRIISIIVVFAIMICASGCGQAESRPQASPPPSLIVSPSPETVPKQTEAEIPENYPAVDVLADENALLSANIITKELTSSIFTYTSPEEPEFNQMLFLCGLSFAEDSEFCYYNIFPMLDNYNIQFKVTNTEKVIQQVFGDYRWNGLTDFGTPPNGGFNEDTQSYEFSTDFGWGMQFYHVAGEVESEFINNSTQVVSSFEMMAPDSSSGDPDHKSIGGYRLIYDIVNENGETFLRFNRYEKE